MRCLDHRQGAAGELGLETADQFLMSVVGHRQIERSLSELDRQDEDEPDEDATQVDDRHMRCLHDAVHIEAAGVHVETDAGDEHHRLVRHHLQHFSLSTDLCIGRVGGESRHDEEHAGQCQGEHHHQQALSCKEHAACHDHEQEEASDVEILHSVDCDLFLLKQLENIVERLQNGRTNTALHSCRNFSVDTGQKPTDERCQDQVCDYTNNHFSHFTYLHNR